MRKRPLAYAGCVFLTGLVCQRYQIKMLWFVITGLIVWEIYSGRKAKNVRKIAGRSVILLSVFLLGIFHMRSEEEFREAYMSKVVDGSQVTVWGELIKTETTEYGIRGILTDCYIVFEEEHIPCNDIMVYFSSEKYQLGRIHKITGKVNHFSHARNQGNFDAVVYYQSLKIDFSLREEVCECYENLSYGVRQGVFHVREQMARVYHTYMKKKPAGFYQAMVLGDKTNLDGELKQLFTLGGIAHILAISGLHVSIVGRGVYRLLRKGGIGFWIAGSISGMLLLLYGVMVGNSTSTIRAVGMLLLFFLSQGVGRSYDMLNALGAMVIYLLWENPFLIENTGFWFSVTALLGVDIVGKELSRKISLEMDKKRKIRLPYDKSGLWMSLGITLTTLPVTALSYYEIPLYAPVVNFVLLPLLTPIFVLALLGGVFGVLFQGEGLAIVLKPCEWLLFFYERVCELATRLPGANLLCGKPEWWQVGLYYVVLFGGVYLLQHFESKNWVSRPPSEEMQQDRKEYNRKRNCMIAAMLGVCFIIIFFPKSHDFEITFLDVGQGDGIYISAGDGTKYFIDGGSSSVNEVGENRILPFLNSKQVISIDYWFVSHCDTDHISGLLEILKKGYKVEHIVLYEQCSDDENCSNLLELIDKVGTKIIYMKAGDKVCSKNFEIRCIAPDTSYVSVDEQNRNENSLVLLAEYKLIGEAGVKALFAGDISTEVENRLYERGLLEDVDLVKANHHGSNYSNGDHWLASLRPEYIVVSCGAHNLYGHPGANAVERMESSGAQIFYTMENGQVTFPLIQ